MAGSQTKQGIRFGQIKSRLLRVKVPAARATDTEIYINIERTIFEPTNDEFTVKIAEKPEEVKSLLEVGFEYVTGEYSDGGKIFRKRK